MRSSVDDLYLHADRNEGGCRIACQQHIDLARGSLDRLQSLARFVGSNGVDRRLGFGYGRNGVLIQAFPSFLFRLFALLLHLRTDLLLGILPLFLEVRLSWRLGWHCR